MSTANAFTQTNTIPPQIPILEQNGPVKEEKQIRSVFVGNIPYEANEDELKTIFSRIGPVITFRIMYDRDTGKPKGYGFCEYRDVETAQSAIRNLNGLELHNRTLRVDSAVNEKGKDEVKEIKSIEIPNIGNVIPTEFTSEDISKIISSMPIDQTYELLNQMKVCVQHNPDECRELLIQNPQLGYALLQSLLLLKIIDPAMTNELLLKRPPQHGATNPPPMKMAPPIPLHSRLDSMRVVPPFRDNMIPIDNTHPTDVNQPPIARRLPPDFQSYPLRMQPNIYPDRTAEHIHPLKNYTPKDPSLPIEMNYISDPDYKEREYRRDPGNVRPSREERDEYFDEDSLREDFGSIIPPKVAQFKNDYNYDHNYDRERYPSPHEYHNRDGGLPPQRSPRIDPRVSQRDKDSRSAQRSISPRDAHMYPDSRDTRHIKQAMQIPSDPRISTIKGSAPDDNIYIRERDRDHRDYIHPSNHGNERSTRYPGSRYASNDRNAKY